MTIAYPIHQAISRIHPDAIRAALAAGASPYDTDDQGYTAWDCLSSNPLFAIFVGSSTPISDAFISSLNEMAQVEPKTIQERRAGELAYVQAAAKAVENSVVLDLIVQKATAAQVPVDPDTLRYLQTLKRGSSSLATLVASRAKNASLPTPDAADLMDAENAHHAATLKSGARARTLVESTVIEQGKLLVPDPAEATTSLGLQDSLRFRAPLQCNR